VRVAIMNYLDQRSLVESMSGAQQNIALAAINAGQLQYVRH
jgi:hypothetical protein